jgi:hypothetical protein
VLLPEASHRFANHLSLLICLLDEEERHISADGAYAATS